MQVWSFIFIPAIKIYVTFVGLWNPIILNWEFICFSDKKLALFQSIEKVQIFVRENPIFSYPSIRLRFKIIKQSMRVNWQVQPFLSVFCCHRAYILVSMVCVQFMCHSCVSSLAFGEWPLSDLAVWKSTHRDEGSHPMHRSSFVVALIFVKNHKQKAGGSAGYILKYFDRPAVQFHFE